MASKSLSFLLFGEDVSASKAFHKVAGEAEKSSSRWSNAAKLGGAAAGLAVIKFGKDSIAAFKDADASQRKLQDAYARFPKLADVNIESLRHLNKEIQNKTKFDDDDLAGAQAVLAQYKLTGAQVRDLTPLLADYAQKTGKDLPTAAGDLGKALLGNGKALKDVGIKFHDLKDPTKNYTELMGGLRTQVGGFAEKEGKTAEGRAEILKNKFGDLEETVGAKLVPTLGKLADVGIKVVDFVGGHTREVEIFAGAIVGIKLAILGVKFAQEGSAAVSAIYMGAQRLLGVTSGTSAIGINAEAAAIERANLAKLAGNKIPAGAPIVAGKTGVAGAAAKIGLTGGVLGAITLPLITSGDQSQLQKWQTQLDSLAKTYPNVKRLGVQAFGALAQAMQKGTITVDEYKAALAAGSVKVAENMANTRHLGDAQRAQTQKAKDAKEAQDRLNIMLGRTPKNVRTTVDVIAAMAKAQIADTQKRMNAFTSANHMARVRVTAATAGAYGSVAALLQYIERQTPMVQVHAVMAPGSPASSIRFNAGGSSFYEGGLTRINDAARGETIDLPMGSRIYPAGQTPPPRGGGRSTIIVQVHNAVVGSDDALARTLVAALNDAQRRGNRMPWTK